MNPLRKLWKRFTTDDPSEGLEWPPPRRPAIPDWARKETIGPIPREVAEEARDLQSRGGSQTTILPS